MDVRFLSTPPHEVQADLLVVRAGKSYAQELSELDRRYDGQLVRWLASRDFDGESAVRVPGFGRIAADELLVVGVGDGSAVRLAHAAAVAGREARTTGARRVALALGALSGPDAAAVVEALSAGNYAYDQHKPESARKPPVEEITVLGVPAPSNDVLRRADVRSRAQIFARDLVNMPAADLHPTELADRARALSRWPNVEVEVWDQGRCAEEGLVGIVAVGQGSVHPGCLIHVRYRPERANGHLALVGKGVTFDSGGLSLKPSNFMQTMRCDMAGAATVLAVASAVAELQLPLALDVLVGAVENMNSGNAYKLGDVLHYANGVTVEIHNTDAEGRLVLADCLIQASRVEGLTALVDVATLTGACAIAVGPDFAGLFTDDDRLAERLHAHAAANAEGLWRLPLHAPYKKMLKAEWAQIKNVGGREGGATTAALFLQHFVRPDVPWAHLDIAGSAFLEGPSSRYAAGSTGEMVRTLVSWAEELAGRE